MPHLIDLRGQRFGRLLVLTDLPTRRGKQTLWRCRCDCGTVKLVASIDMRTGHTRSCGCLQRETVAKLKLTHGMGRDGSHRTPEYGVWLIMKQRCSNPKMRQWHDYGGRGIQVCDRWRQSFPAFYADMGPRPPTSDGYQREYSIDRINNNGHYEPGNCRWATYAEQSKHTRRTRLITFQGQTRTYTEWERHLGFSSQLIRQRIKLGWSIERILTTSSR